MNIVLVNDFAHVNGGAGQVALSSARALAQRGHTVTLFTGVLPREPGLGGPNLAVICTEQRDIASDPNRLRAAVQGVWNFPAQRTMRGLLDSFERDDTVVHFHGWTKALSSSVIAECLSRQYRCVATLHDYFSACPNGGFFNYQSQANCALVPLSAACISTHCDARSYPQKLWRVGRQVVQRSAGMFPGRMQHFISISDLSEAILKRYLPENARLHRVRNPIDVPYGERAAVQDHDGFVCVGRLSPEKGGMLLAKACNSLGVRVTFVGEGPMRDAILAAGPAARVTGWLTADLVRDRIRHCRALVLPSLWYEAQPLVVSEAAALGVPVIVADNCAAREAVVDGVTGYWFRSGDAEDLKDKLSRLHNDPGLADAMGKAAFENYWREPPTLQRHVSELELVYARVLADT